MSLALNGLCAKHPLNCTWSFRQTHRDKNNTWIQRENHSYKWGIGGDPQGTPLSLHPLPSSLLFILTPIFSSLFHPTSSQGWIASALCSALVTGKKFFYSISVKPTNMLLQNRSTSCLFETSWSIRSFKLRRLLSSANPKGLEKFHWGRLLMCKSA